MEDIRISNRLEPIVVAINRQNMPESQKLEAIGRAVEGVLSSVEEVVRPKPKIRPSILPERDEKITDWLIAQYEKMKADGVPEAQILLSLDKLEHGALVRKREES